MNAGDISVVVPCYNREHCLGRAIESVLAQDVKVGELIVVDDGSQDGSAGVASAYGPPVRVIRTPNRGGSAARNLGIREASGSWIAFLDSDDVWANDKIRRQIQALQVFPSAGLVFCDQRVVDETGQLLESRFSLGGVRDTCVAHNGETLFYDRSLFPELLTQSRVFTSAVLVRRDLKGLVFPEDYRACQDWPVWLRLALETPFVAVDKVLVEMWRGKDNITNNALPLFRYSLDCLQELRGNEGLTESERQAVKEAYERRCLGALYYGVRLGDVDLAARVMRSAKLEELSRIKKLIYRLLMKLPSPVLRLFGQLTLPHTDSDIPRAV